MCISIASKDFFERVQQAIECPLQVSNIMSLINIDRTTDIPEIDCDQTIFLVQV